jgi:hypothetical protein
MSTQTIGGDRLGAGQKEKVYLHNYNRSSHDRSYLWRSSMSAGTLVPFMSELFTPGSSGTCELNVEVMTLPTIGPLFGSYKVQLDVFQIPMRLFIGDLQYNKLNVGMNMANVEIPQIFQTGYYDQNDPTKEQINTSNILRYLGVSGLGKGKGGTSRQIGRAINAIPLLNYYSIFKNYYANLQEEKAYVIHSDINRGAIEVTAAVAYMPNGQSQGDIWTEGKTIDFRATTYTDYIQVAHDGGNVTFNDPIFVEITKGGTTATHTLEELFNNRNQNAQFVTYTGPNKTLQEYESATIQVTTNTIVPDDGQLGPQLQPFDLTKIDDLEALVLDKDFIGMMTDSTQAEGPLSYLLQHEEGSEKVSATQNQEGLLVKTYQSDLNNNWVNTEWLDGAEGVNAISAVDTSGGSFTVDTLNLAEKVYNMLNRIAVSGGSYDDWLDAVYAHDRAKAVHSPQYLGSLIKELAFQEVISTAEAGVQDDPLGTLGGRGKLTGKHKGGHIKFKVDEPSYIMGIVSLTPRIDYSHSFKWDMDLKNYGQLHAPALDGIGFQDKLTQDMHYLGTEVEYSTSATPKYDAVGKQPAWIQYMTNINKTYGNFADYTSNGEAYMTLNRRYEINEEGAIQDLTTYIDPSKMNHIFAQTQLDAQNFWVQISNKMITRQKMSAKQIPNL